MAWSATNSICSMSSSGPEVTTRAIAWPAFSSGGNQFSVSSFSPVVYSQSSAKASVSCSTIGPSSWKCVSRTTKGGLSALMFSAPILRPPVKPMRPSTTITLRWLRRFTNGMRQGKYECRKRATGTPARLQMVVGARPEIAAADAVDQHPHLDAAALRLDQRLVEGLARLVGAEDVAHQADALLGRRRSPPACADRPGRRCAGPRSCCRARWAGRSAGRWRTRAASADPWPRRRPASPRRWPSAGAGGAGAGRGA